ncbi:MAG: hypothetical protein ACF8MJ_05885 [Phycisphaerales bacterium JB050]
MAASDKKGGIVVVMSEDAIPTQYGACSRTGLLGAAWTGRGVRAMGVLCLVAGLALGGCGKALFPETEPRTQFDRYDRSRDEYAPTYIEDEFGRRQPNLTGRLSPKR